MFLARGQAMYSCRRAAGEFFLRRRRNFFKITPKSQVFLRKNLRFFKNLLTAKGGYKGVSNQKAEPKFLLTGRGDTTIRGGYKIGTPGTYIMLVCVCSYSVFQPA